MDIVLSEGETQVDPDNEFENSFVVAYDRKFSVMHGQGSHFWVTPLEEVEDK